MSTLGKLTALTAAQWRVLINASWQLPLAGAAAKLTSVKGARRLLSGLSLFRHQASPATPAALQKAQSIARMVNVAARRGLYRARCLEKSLVIEAMLKHRGIPCELRFGVNSATDDFSAHAWVEVQGQALADKGGLDPAISALT